jgi:hypothetical protein
MFLRVLRSVGAVAAGIAVAFVLAIAVELFSSLVHPFPAGSGGTFEEICEHVARYPAWVLAVVVGAWGLTVFVSTWTAGRLGNRACAAVVGLLLLAAVFYNVALLPYPIWFEIVVVIAIALAGAWACRLSGRRTAHRPPADAPAT